eukprot:Em0002g963a
MAVPAASDLNSVEFSYSVGTSGVHSWEQSVDPYDPTGHGSRPVRSKKDLKPHEYNISHAVGEVDSIADTPGSTWLLKIHVFPQIGVGLSGQAVRPAGLRPDPWLAYGNPEFSYSVGTSGVHSWEQSVDPYDPTGHGSRPVRSKKT